MRIFLHFSIVFLMLSNTYVVAQGTDSWSVQQSIIGKKGKPSEDVSGIACSKSTGFPRECVVIDDNLQSAQRVTIHDGRIEPGPSISLIKNQFDGKQLELDGEGVAFSDANGKAFFYIIGSHGHPRDKNNKLDPVVDRDLIAARISAASQIVRFEAKTDVTDITPPAVGSLTTVIAGQSELAAFADKRLEANGLTIEGIAVVKERLFAGFRAPTLQDGKSLVLSVNLEGVFGAEPADPRLYHLALGKHNGVRDLAPYGSGILILAGPSGDFAGEYAVYWWDMVSEEVQKLGDLASITESGSRKAEALLPLDEGLAGLRVLVMFDGEKNGRPTTITIQKPK